MALSSAYRVKGGYGKSNPVLSICVCGGGGHKSPIFPFGSALIYYVL